MAAAEDEEAGKTRDERKGRLSLRSVPFQQAVSEIRKVKPPGEKKKRRGKRRKKQQ